MFNIQILFTVVIFCGVHSAVALMVMSKLLDQATEYEACTVLHGSVSDLPLVLNRVAALRFASLTVFVQRNWSNSRMCLG